MVSPLTTRCFAAHSRCSQLWTRVQKRPHAACAHSFRYRDYSDVQEWLSHLNLEHYKDKVAFTARTIAHYSALILGQFMEFGIDGPILCEMKKEVSHY